MKHIHFAASVFLLLTAACFSQSLEVFDVNTNSYPTIIAKFYAFDNNDSLFKNISPSDLKLFENGIQRNVTSVSCPTSTPAAISSVLVLDVSGSMCVEEKLSIAQAAALTWINILPLGSSECAISSFSDESYIIQDFTTDRNKLTKGINDLKCIDGTNYDAAFLNPMSGGIPIAKTGIHKRIVVFLTDGIPNFNPQTEKIINDARSANITIYCVTIGFPAPKCMKDISIQTGGVCFENIKSAQEAEECYKKIQMNAMEVNPCTIKWQSGVQCNSSNVCAVLDLLSNNSKDTVVYPAPAASVAMLKAIPNAVYFVNIPPGSPKDTTITVKAINSSFNVIDITSSNPLFSITPKSFSLDEGMSKPLTVTYNPVDSNNSFSIFNFISNQCQSYFYALGGFSDKKNANQLLRLTHPNGGEVFKAGSDTVITWTGILPNDTVVLEYSTDLGNQWETLTTKAFGYIHNWKELPHLESNQCLVRVSTSIKEPPIKWAKCYGGKNNDESRSIRNTADGGFIGAGYSFSDDADVSGNHGGGDFWVVKLSGYGNIEWQKCYGGSGWDEATSIQVTKDGGYIIAGFSESKDGDVTGNHGSGDFWVVKLNAAGNIEWQECLGGSGWDEATSIQVTKDGGYIVAGFTESEDGDVTFNHGGGDFWIVKLSEIGNIEWQKCLGGSGWDKANSIQQTNDGGYIVTGETNSNNGDVKGNHGSYDAWLVKLSKTGVIVWQKCYGGSDYDGALAVGQTTDGGYIMACGSSSNNGDVNGNHGNSDFWILRLTSTGYFLWEKTFGGSKDDYANSIIETSDGNYLVAGTTQSNNGDVIGNRGGPDFWVIKISNTGLLRWQKCLGGNNAEEANSILEAGDGSYVVAGWSGSSLGDVSGNHNSPDYWVVKFAEPTVYRQDKSDSPFSIVKPHAMSKDINMNKCDNGSIKDSVVKSFLSNISGYNCRIDSIYFIGADASAFDVIPLATPFELEAGGSKDIEFRFMPFKFGFHNAQIVVLTQGDTLISNIEGEGISPQLYVSTPSVDFDTVKVGTARDTVITAMIQNLKTVPIFISGIEFLGPNTNDFSLSSGANDTSFILYDNFTTQISLRFKPSDIGRTSGRLAFHYSGQINPSEVVLFGAGYKTTPRISASYPGSINLICGTETTDTIHIKNAGRDTLRIYSIKITGPDTNDFSTDNIITSLLPDSSINLFYHFKPVSIGIKHAGFEIISNSDPDSILTILLTATKDSVSIIPDFSTVDLGFICPNEIKDSVIILTNHGTIRSCGYIILSQNLQAPIKEFVISAGNSYHLNYTFSGLSKEGIIIDTISIVDTICNYTNQVLIKEEVALPIMDANNLTISSVIGGSKDDKIIITNNSKRDFIITGNTPISLPFRIIGNPYPVKVNKGDTVEIPVRYTPVDSENDTSYIYFNIEPCNIIDSIKIDGIFEPATASLKIDTIEGHPGDIIIVPIILSNQENIQLSKATYLKTDLSFNQSILLPLDYNKQLINDESAKITIDNLPVSTIIGDTLAKIRFIVGLGNAEECNLSLSNAKATGGTLDINLFNGLFRLLGVCHEGGPRLIYGNSAITIICKPNPVNNKVEFDFETFEDGYTELFITDILGNKVHTVFESSVHGKYSIESDLSLLSKGVYVYTLQTPTARVSRLFIMNN